jgi:hypothetical protein
VIVVLQYSGHRVHVLDKVIGRPVRALGGEGSTAGHFNQPLGVATDPLEPKVVYVAEWTNERIQVRHRTRPSGSVAVLSEAPPSFYKHLQSHFSELFPGWAGEINKMEKDNSRETITKDRDLVITLSLGRGLGER